MTQKINVVLFGIGKAGSAFINKVIKNRKELVLENQLDLRFPVITSSTTAFFEKDGVNYSWEANFIQFAIPFRLEDVMYYLVENNLENAILVDATSSEALASEYPDLIKSGFNLVSINRKAIELPANLKRGVEFLAVSRGLTFNYLSPLRPGKEAAADALFEAVLEIAEKKKTEVA
jgi:homoserine dehydrogenase/aspartokinase/homoserine dehydrogenase 1